VLEVEVEVQLPFLGSASSTFARAWGVSEIVDPDAALVKDFGEA
jgi:hypothetical protein